MPFWWRRRRKPWFRRFTYKRRTYKPRRKRFPRRRRHRRFTRRHRRRRRKVKRKKPFLKLLQWQPDSIRKCKIKTISTLLLGYNGMQHRNFTTAQNEWTLPRTPGGGGFSTTVFSLQYLYELWVLRKNIWTYPNTNYDLCRYTGCKIQFFRHAWWDFVVTYQLMYPMSMGFPDYMECQPLRMLLQQRKIIIKSLKHKPNGKLSIIKKFKPPKQMVNKWFFQEMLAPKPLLLVKAAVCDLLQPDLGPSGGNRLISLTCINIHDLYQHSDWGLASTHGYSPIATWTSPKQIWVVNKQGRETELTIPAQHTVGYADGWFQKQIMQAVQIKPSKTENGIAPTYQARYNPAIDTGEGNYIYFCSITASNYDRPRTDKVLFAQEQPLWLLLFGFQDYVTQLKKPAETLPIYFLIIVSKFIEPHTGSLYPKTHLIIDNSFIKGVGPFDSPLPGYDLNKWYPTLRYQQESIANIVKTGPFIPKPDPTKANWELHIKSTFYFKWGGSLQQDTQVNNPADKKDYDVPDKIQSALQVTDPQTQVPETMLHSWDFRRGYITTKALKRMSEHFKTDSIVSTDSDSSQPQKRAKLTVSVPLLKDQEPEEKTCLQTLFEKSFCQEEETDSQKSLQHLIKQQQQQQQGIKLKLLQLITHMKRTQQQLQLHTGLLE
nr:MAG: ORF1 [Torque teno midi virus]